MKLLEMNGRIFLPHEYKNEAELQSYVERNFRNIFGKDAVWFSGKRIGAKRGEKGARGKPDGFVVNLQDRRWSIIEVELARHSLYDHIHPQVSKFAVAWKKHRKNLVDNLFTELEESDSMVEDFMTNGIKDHYKFISDLIDKQPDLVIVIDEYTEELDDLRDILKFETSWLIFNTYTTADSHSPNRIHHMDTMYDLGSSAESKEDAGTTRISPTRKLVFLGRIATFRYSKEIPQIVANALVKEGKLTESKIPWGPGRNRYLVSAKATHPKGNPFFQPAQLDNGWWVETHAAEDYQLRLASKLIEHCDETNSEVRIEPL